MFIVMRMSCVHCHEGELCSLSGGWVVFIVMRVGCVRCHEGGLCSLS